MQFTEKNSVQLKSRERRVLKNPKDKKTSYAQTKTNDFEKSYIVKIDTKEWFKSDRPRECHPPHHPVFH